MISYSIKNILAVGNLGKELNLNLLAVDLEESEWEPQGKMKALIYRIASPKATFLIFASGKFICTGVATEKNLKAAIEILEKEIADNPIEMQQ